MLQDFISEKRRFIHSFAVPVRAGIRMPLPISRLHQAWASAFGHFSEDQGKETNKSAFPQHFLLPVFCLLECLVNKLHHTGIIGPQPEYSDAANGGRRNQRAK